MLSHITFGSNDLQRAGAFYNEALSLLGIVRQESYDEALGYARKRDGAPWIWIMTPSDGLPATWGNGSHLALMSESREQVDLFHAGGDLERIVELELADPFGFAGELVQWA